MADKRPALGRGLSALIPDATGPALDDRSLDVDSDLLRPNRFQPRTTLDEAKIGNWWWARYLRFSRRRRYLWYHARKFPIKARIQSANAFDQRGVRCEK